MILLDGKKVSSEIIQKLETRIKEKTSHPGLGIILVGNRNDSLKYVEAKKKVCSKIGIKFHLIHLEETCKEDLRSKDFPSYLEDNQDKKEGKEIII